MAFHLKLINRNETTNEFLKGRGNARNYTLREGSACKRFMRVWCYRKPPSLITNDLIRQSLFIEKIVDKDGINQSFGGTPRRDMAAKWEGATKKLKVISRRKVSQTPLCASSSRADEDISIDESSFIVPTTQQPHVPNTGIARRMISRDKSKSHSKSHSTSSNRRKNSPIEKADTGLVKNRHTIKKVNRVEPEARKEADFPDAHSPAFEHDNPNGPFRAT